MNSVSPIHKLDAPKNDIVEVSLFGPSYGECVAVHVGDGAWFVIDSCVVPGGGGSRPLAYFNSIGVDASKAIKKIIVTHWDDDHIKGLSELLEVATDSDLIISGALLCKEFVELVTLYDSGRTVRNGRVKELNRALRMLVKRRKKPVLAHAQMSLWNRLENGQETGTLVSLSPSNAEVIKGHVNISRMLMNRQLSSENRNDRAIVLWLKIGTATALLGSDLLNSPEHDCGWSAILNSPVTRSKSQVFKIPHHGSSTSHNTSVWANLLDPQPPAILAPWRKGVRALPTRPDIERMRQYTDQLFVTAIPQNTKVSRPADINRMIQSTVRSIRKVDQSLGHIRLRANCKETNPKWSVELFGGARKIEGKMEKAFPAPAKKS